MALTLKAIVQIDSVIRHAVKGSFVMWHHGEPATYEPGFVLVLVWCV